MRKSKKTLGVLGIAALMAGLGIAAAPASAVPEQTSEIAAAPVAALSPSDQQFIEFVEANPGDYAAHDRLAQKLFGSRVYVKFEGAKKEVTGDVASRLIAQSQTSEVAPLGDVGIASLPIDTFTPTISRSAISSGMWVAGHTTFRNDWAGQASPHDVGSLQFSAPGCVVLANHAIATSPLGGLGYLHSANVTAKSPVWRINDHMNGFVMQAKNVTASVVLQKSGCSGSQSISAAWRYEANQVGSITSISASFGSLSIGYSGSPLKIQKSSSVLNFTF